MPKQHPTMVTTTLQGDGVTIKYDATKPNRSDAVGKAYKLVDGRGVLVADGDEIHGKVLAVEDNQKFTAAYQFGGLNFPLGDSATVSTDKGIVGALDADGNPGFVKAAPDINAAASDQAALVTSINAHLKGKGTVLDFDTENALVAM